MQNGQIVFVYKLASFMIFSLRKYRYVLNRQILMQIYVAFIRPVQGYASDVGFGCSASDVEKIEKV